MMTNFLDVVMPMYNLLEYSDNFNKTTGSMYDFDRDVCSDKRRPNMDIRISGRKGKKKRGSCQSR